MGQTKVAYLIDLGDPQMRRRAVVEVLETTSEQAYVRAVTPIGHWQGRDWFKESREDTKKYVNRLCLVDLVW